jgi:short-subunit dehydrogenase
MDDTFANRGFLITGAASGIGLATARVLRQRGARLVLWDQNAERLDDIGRELNAHAAPVDITDTIRIQDAMQRAVEHLGTLDGVVHSAGILRAGLFEEIDLQSHCRVIEVNLTGTVAVAYASLPYLKASRGSLVMLASTAAAYGSPEYASYGAAKAGVLNFAQALRVELESAGVHVGVVSPLFVSSPMLDGYNGQTRLLRSGSPLVEIRSPEQIAEVIVRGIERRQFMIWPGWKPRLIFWASRYLSALGHVIMRRAWR